MPICYDWRPLWLPFRQCKRCGVENTWIVPLIWFTLTLDCITTIWQSGCKTWFVIRMRKHTEVKFGWQEDKQVCKTWRLLFKSSYRGFLTILFPGNLKGTWIKLFSLRSFSVNSISLVAISWNNSQSLWVSAETTHKMKNIYS